MASSGAVLLAYLDPGSGSIMLQVVLGAVAASGVAISLMWRQARGWAARMLGRKATSSSDEPKE